MTFCISTWLIWRKGKKKIEPACYKRNEALFYVFWYEFLTTIMGLFSSLWASFGGNAFLQLTQIMQKEQSKKKKKKIPSSIHSFKARAGSVGSKWVSSSLNHHFLKITTTSVGMSTSPSLIQWWSSVVQHKGTCCEATSPGEWLQDSTCSSQQQQQKMLQLFNCTEKRNPFSQCSLFSRTGNWFPNLCISVVLMTLWGDSERFMTTRWKVTIYWASMELVNKCLGETEELTVVQPASYLSAYPCLYRHRHTPTHTHILNNNNAPIDLCLSITTLVLTSDRNN